MTISERRFPERFDVPSVTVVSAAVSNLAHDKNTGKSAAVGGERSHNRTEENYPAV